MSLDPQLFDATTGDIPCQRLARASDPFTSHEAAAKADQCASQAAVLWTLKTHGPQTDDRIATHVEFMRLWTEEKPFSPSRLRTARKELMRMDPPKVRACGTTRNSRNRTVLLFERTN